MVVSVVARQQGRELAEVAREAGAEVIAGSSLKATLDLDWDDPAARRQGLQTLLQALAQVQEWVSAQHERTHADADIQAGLVAAQQVRTQDIVESEGGADPTPALRTGVAKDRRISITDPAMRHGRKSRSQRVDGYKRHVLRDLDLGVIRAVGVTPANVPEATVTPDLVADLAAQGIALEQLDELHIDRAYLSSPLVRDRPKGLTVYCKAWPVRNGDHFAKTAFTLNWERGTIQCPNAVEIAFHVGRVVHFPAETCAVCPVRPRCTSSAHGRSVSIHRDERLLTELRQRQLTPTGRAKLRERVAVEHDLAHVGQWQGDRARYRGIRKNLFDVRRTAVVSNLHVLDRVHQAAECKAA